jgi:16S rRNA (uracil1498-N3)-methyltransferase
LPLDPAQSRYLGSVLRLREGDSVRFFNAEAGEWLYRISRIAKRAGVAEPVEQRRAPEEANLGPILFFAPVKRTQTELLVQKATELGAASLRPVITARTNRDQVRLDRLEAIAAEAAEQCERLSIPSISEPEALFDALFNCDGFVFCDEAGGDPHEPWGGAEGRAGLADQVFGPVATTPRGILIGPEGGFTPEERETLRADKASLPISLGPRILRAETAAIAALTLWQLRFGDLAAKG